MGGFRESIVKNEVPHATHRDLKWEQWHQQYLARRTDLIDDEIYKAGGWIHVRLRALRGEIDRLAKTLDPQFPTLRALVAVAN